MLNDNNNDNNNRNCNNNNRNCNKDDITRPSSFKTMTTTPQQSTDPSRSLLLQLKPDYEGKQTCRECLRSKANPSPVVIAIVQNHQDWLTASSLLQAQELLISDYLPLLKTNVTTSIEGFCRLGTMFRFLQLLLVQMEKLAPDQVPGIAARLIQCMTKELSSVPVAEKEEEEEEGADLLTSDASTTLDRRQVVCFAFLSLLRLNHYAKTQIGLIAPLWRGICDLQKLSTVPQQMLEDAMQQLLSMLQDGYPLLLNSVISASVNTNVGSFVMQGKLISFLAMRLANLLVPTNTTTKLRTKAYTVMLSLRGLDLIATDLSKPEQSNINPAMQKTCRAIASKIEKSLVGTIMSTDCTIHRPALDCLVQATVSTTSKNNEHATVARLSYTAFYLAKAGLLQAILRHVAAKDEAIFANNADALLVVCESLHSVALPQCYAPLTLACRRLDSEFAKRLMADSIQTLANTLSRIDASLESSSSIVQRLQLHRLLVRWMAPNKTVDLHPISREVVLSLLYLFLVGIENNSQHAFLALLVKLFFDPRSGTSLRSNLSSLLVMILSSNSNNSKIRDSARKVMEVELEGILKKESRKRKISIPHVFSCKHYYFDDVLAISRVLIHLPTSSECLIQTMQRFCQRIVQGGSFSHKEDIPTPRLAKVEHTCLVMALMQGTLLVNPSIDSFQAKTGVSLLEFQQAFIQAVTVLPTQQNDTSIRKHALLCSSMLRFCAIVCMSEQREEVSKMVPIGDLCGFLSFCTDKPFLPSSTASGKEGEKLAGYRSTVLFDAIRLLRSIGNAIPPTCPQPILQVRCRCTFSAPFLFHSQCIFDHFHRMSKIRFQNYSR
jgi:hypothetical protein